jgi:hypothetical protein
MLYTKISAWLSALMRDICCEKIKIPPSTGGQLRGGIALRALGLLLAIGRRRLASAINSFCYQLSNGALKERLMANG